MLKFLLKGLCVGLASVLLYNFVILPVTVPELVLDDRWTEEDLSWRSEDIFWFIQVTDIHISKYVWPDIQESLEEFMSTTLDTIGPGLMLVSGDLTDGKDKGGVDSFQIKQEWQTYSHILAKHNVLNKTVYLDIRGNHDTFDVHHINHTNNLHREYSIKGVEYPSTYVYDYEFGGKIYSFFAVDATLKTGPKKVFNFLGQLSSQDLVDIQAEKRTRDNNTQIFFGHYPSSCIVAPSPGFRSLLQGGLVYLSGHLHTLGGLAPELYSLHRGGTPELELGDWKENRKFRVLAIDNGILTFSDNVAGDWPVVVVTNPKSSRFLAPKVEPLQKIRKSSEIRILAFSPFGLKQVQVQINSEQPELCKKHPSVPDLYLLPWHPELLPPFNKLTVLATDHDGNTKTVKLDFQVEFDQMINSYSLYARMILMTDVITVLQAVWVTSIVLALLPVLLARYRSSVLRELYSLSTCTKMSELAEFSPFFYLYCTTAILVGFGPWHVGEILSGHTGVVFPWGLVVAGQFLPSFYPYVFAFVHLIFFQTPLFWSLLYKFKWRLERSSSKVLLAVSNIPVTLVLSSQAIMLTVLYYFPSKLGIFREICLMIAPVEISTIIVGFILNGLVSYRVGESRRA